jgi:type II secretory pathway component GspD/PulD (secretin)
VTRTFRTIVAATALFVLVSCRAGAQQPAAAPPASSPAAAKPSAVLLRVQVVISRHQGDKTVSSQPYTLTATADGSRANMRMALQVPVPMTVMAEGKPTSVSYNYKDLGTNIDCSAKTLDGGRYLLDISLEDSWMVPDDQNSAVKGVPQFRSFRISNATAMLRDGQTTQLTTATEKVNGESVHVDVTMNVVK